MKFVIESKQLKRMIQRAMVICPKKGLPTLTSLYIEANKEKQIVTVKAFNLDTFISVFADSVVITENGRASANCNDLLNLLNIQGSISVIGDGEKITVKSTRKKSEVKDNKEIINVPKFPGIDIECMFTAEKSDLTATLETLSKFVAVNSTRPIFNGFYVESGKSRVVTCDSHRITYKKVNWNFNGDNVKIIIPGKCAKELSKIATGVDETISVRCGTPEGMTNKMVAFVGSDFAYLTRAIPGEYIDTDAIMQSQLSNFSFKVSAKQLSDITKDYIKIVTEENLPMYFGCVNGKMLTVAINSKYKTSDIIDIGYDGKNYKSIFNPNGFMFACNAKYLNDAITTFDTEFVSVTGGRGKSWIFSNTSYVSMILPVEVQNEKAINDYIINL